MINLPFSRLTVAKLRGLIATLAVACSVSDTIESAEVVTFETRPYGAAGTTYGDFYNGDLSASDALREDFTITGTSAPFGDSFPQTDQRWTAGPVDFSNGYISSFGSWTGWSWSRVADTSTPGFANQYAAFPGGGATGDGGIDDGGSYAVASGSSAIISDPAQVAHPYFNVTAGHRLESVEVTNTTYAGLSLTFGDAALGEPAFAKRFGGETRNDPDFFSVTFTGYDAADAGGNVIGVVEVLLADYRFSDNALDRVLDQWELIDLAPIESSRSVALSFQSSDTASGFINTPVFVAIDNLRVSAVPEPSGLVGLAFAAAAGWIIRRRRVCWRGAAAT